MSYLENPTVGWFSTLVLVGDQQKSDQHRTTPSGKASRTWTAQRDTHGRSLDTSYLIFIWSIALSVLVFCGFLRFLAKVIQISRSVHRSVWAHIDQTMPGDVPEGLPMKTAIFWVFGKMRNHRARGSPPKTRYCGHLNSRLMHIWSQVLVPNWLSYYVGEREWDTEE